MPSTIFRSVLGAHASGEAMAIIIHWNWGCNLDTRFSGAGYVIRPRRKSDDLVRVDTGIRAPLGGSRYFAKLLTATICHESLVRTVRPRDPIDISWPRSSRHSHSRQISRSTCRP